VGVTGAAYHLFFFIFGAAVNNSIGADFVHDTGQPVVTDGQVDAKP
jgi:hypothetical protein